MTDSQTDSPHDGMGRTYAQHHAAETGKGMTIYLNGPHRITTDHNGL